MPDAFAYSIVTINDVRKTSPGEVRRRAKKGNKGFDLRKSRSVEHLSDHSESSANRENGLSESPLVSESLDVESHIYATVNKKRHAPSQPQRTPPPLAAKPSPRNSQGEESKMASPRSPVPLPLAEKTSHQHSLADENGVFFQEAPVVEPPDRELDDSLASNDVAGEDDKSKESRDGDQDSAHVAPVKRRPVYAVVVKSSEQEDGSPKEGNTSQEFVVSGCSEGGAFPPNAGPAVSKGKKGVPPPKPAPCTTEPKFAPSQPPSHPPPIQTTSSKSASKYAHLMKTPPPSHIAPKPPTQRTADLSHFRNISLPSHPPPAPPPGGSRPPKPARSRSEDGGAPLTSDPIYEAVDENDATESLGPLPTLKPKYPLLKPKHKPAPPPPNIKKAKSLDSPTSKGGSLGQSPPHETSSQVKQKFVHSATKRNILHSHACNFYSPFCSGE